MNRASRACLLAAVAASPLLLGTIAHAADEQPISAAWKVQEITYSYMGFTTAYSCDAFEDKLESILKTLGAHPNTKVRATGCPTSRPSRNFFVSITTATPVAAADVKVSDAEKSKQELLKRLGVKSDFGSEPFPAVWKTVDLAKERKLNIEPGDCELMEGVRDRVLPKLAVKIESQSITCTPHQVGLTPPQLKVSALAPLPSADVKDKAGKEAAGT